MYRTTPVFMSETLQIDPFRRRADSVQISGEPFVQAENAEDAASFEARATSICFWTREKK